MENESPPQNDDIKNDLEKEEIEKNNAYKQFLLSNLQKEQDQDQ